MIEAVAIFVIIVLAIVNIEIEAKRSKRKQLEDDFVMDFVANKWRRKNK